MKKTAQVKKLVKNNKGQGVMEYMIITSLVGILCIGAMKGFGEVVQERLNKAKSKITKSISIR
jgi:Flp pilus assembly pilin Flp